MSSEHFISALTFVTLFAFVVNLPFGYLRVKTRRLSLMWFIYIHLPIPLVIILRKYAGFGYSVVPILLAGSVFGQFIGGRLRGLKPT